MTGIGDIRQTKSMGTKNKATITSLTLNSMYNFHKNLTFTSNVSGLPLRASLYLNLPETLGVPLFQGPFGL